MVVLMCTAPVLALAADLHVGAGREFSSVSAALAAADPGDTVFVHDGIYREGLIRIEKPVILVGIDSPKLDGGGAGDILHITASNVTVRGFEVRNSGPSGLADIAGIKVANASNITIEDNRILDCSFGIHLSKARDSVIRRNEIRGASVQGESDGNGVHTWSCERIEITDNRVLAHRDGIYLDFTTDATVVGNFVEGNLRYGLHFMFSHRSAYRKNTFDRNGAGVAVMYSREVQMEDNRFRHSWGGAAYGLLLKDISDSRITGNTFEFNSIAVTMQNSNRIVMGQNQFRENGWALQVQSSCTDNEFVGNNFIGNSFDLSTSGMLELNRFTANYWDRAETFDLDRDGVSDVPHRPLSLFAMVVERMPAALLLLRSPLVHFLDRAERIFPSLTPDHVIDTAPAMRPHVAGVFVAHSPELQPILRSTP